MPGRGAVTLFVPDSPFTFYRSYVVLPGGLFYLLSPHTAFARCQLLFDSASRLLFYLCCDVLLLLPYTCTRHHTVRTCALVGSGLIPLPRTLRFFTFTAVTVRFPGPITLPPTAPFPVAPVAHRLFFACHKHIPFGSVGWLHFLPVSSLSPR